MASPYCFAQFTSATKGSCNVRPSGVIAYSTATGDEAITRRLTSPLRSSRRIASVRDLWVMGSSLRLMALKRER